MSKQLLAFVFGLCLCVAWGCDKQPNSPPAATNPSGGSESSTASPGGASGGGVSGGTPSGGTASGGAASGGAKLSVVYIPKNLGNPYCDSLIAGFQKAADELGVDFTTVGPATADATSQLSIIKDQVQRGVNVLAISPNSVDALDPALEEAMAKGVTVITVDSDLNGNEQYRNACVLTVDPQAVGQNQVELMGSLMGYQGKFAILSATTDAPNQNTWIGFMKQTMAADPKYKDMQLVEIVYGNDEPQKSLTEAEALLTKYPDLKGIASPTSVGVVAAAQCVENAGKAGQIAVTGLGTPNQMRRFIKDGTVKTLALWNPADEGYLSCQLGIQLVNKTIKAAPGVKLKAGSLGEREIGPKNIVITEKPLVFTKDNIDQFNF